jgi:hypothetical protein
MKRTIINHIVDCGNGEQVRFTVCEWTPNFLYHYEFFGYCTFTGYRSAFIYADELVGVDLKERGIALAKLLNADLRKLNKKQCFNIDYLKAKVDDRERALTKEEEELDFITLQIITGGFN